MFYLCNIFWDGNLKTTEYFYEDGSKMSTMEEIWDGDEIVYRRIWDHAKEKFIYEKYFQTLD